MKINKKAAASLIAWVLLVGLSVTLAGLVTTWAIKSAKKFEPEKFAGPEVYCDNVAISLENGNIKNRGSLTIVSIYCVPTTGDPVENTVSILPSSITSNLCSTGSEIIPGIKDSKGEIIYCSIKRIKT